MANTYSRACLAAGLSFALLTGSAVIAQDEPPAKPADPTRSAPPGRGQDGAPGRGGQGGQGAPGRRGGGGGAQSVEQAMNGMGRALRALKSQIADAAKKDDNLSAINAMQQNCVAAKGMRLPAEVHKDVTDPAARAKLATEYRTHLIQLLKELIELEQYVMEGKADRAEKKLDEIIALRDKSHGEMGVKDEEKAPPASPQR